MILTAYPQANDRGELHVWVGMLGDSFAAGGAPPPTFEVDGQAVTPLRGSMKLVETTGRDWTGRFVLPPPPSRPEHRVQVSAAGQSVVFTVQALPEELPDPMEGEFRVLLCSCYSQPEDDADIEEVLVRRLKLRPHLSIMAGDQVYLDLPISLPRTASRLKEDLRDKYIANWTSASSGARGIMGVLQLAPVLTVPDDHEYWNNYPYAQAQLPDTWSQQRDVWAHTARDLYEAFQRCESSRNGAIRLSVGPLRLLCIDMRSDRDSDAKQLMPGKAWDEFDDWIKDLKTTPGTVGVLCSGQALLVERRNPLFFNAGDAEMPNYGEFERMAKALDDLASHGIPVVYLTGDVHWGRLAEARHENRPMLYEVISSPSTQIHLPGDAPKKLFQGVKEFFGASPKPWPLHAEADKVPARFGPDGRFWPKALRESVPGNQVAVIGFRRRGTGVEFTVTYYFVSKDQMLNKPVVCGPFPLNRQ